MQYCLSIHSFRKLLFIYTLLLKYLFNEYFNFPIFLVMYFFENFNSIFENFEFIVVNFESIFFDIAKVLDHRTFQNDLMVHLITSNDHTTKSFLCSMHKNYVQFLIHYSK